MYQHTLLALYSACLFIKIKFIVLYYKHNIHFIDNVNHMDKCKEKSKKGQPDFLLKDNHCSHFYLFFKDYDPKYFFLKL